MQKDKRKEDALDQADGPNLTTAPVNDAQFHTYNLIIGE